MNPQLAIRSAQSLLRALGGATISLRLPAASIAPGAAGELGLAPPLYQDVPLAPAFVRSLANSKPDFVRAKFEVLISATAVQQQITVNNFSSADDLFSSALGILYNGDLLRIENVSADSFGGVAYLYRVTATLN